jgi:predicted regulator of Ras-like GTPase activity (Roadblock/LC7/MglB family)
MTFQEILAKIVDGTPGAVGGAIMGADGIPVDEYVREGSRVDLPTVAVEFQSVVEQARKVAGSLEGDGELHELVLMTTSHQLLFRQVDDEYFVVVALHPTGTLGKARYLVRCLLRDLQEGL